MSFGILPVISSRSPLHYDFVVCGSSAAAGPIEVGVAPLKRFCGLGVFFQIIFLGNCCLLEVL